MGFNDTAPVMEPQSGPPLGLERLAENAALEVTVLKPPIEGQANILAVIRHAVSLHEFQQHSCKGVIAQGLSMKSYRSRIQGVPIETLPMAHLNQTGEADPVVINHRPPETALPFSVLMRDRVGERFRDHCLSESKAAVINEAFCSNAGGQDGTSSRFTATAQNTRSHAACAPSSTNRRHRTPRN